jgi:hypothetical protein
MAMAPAVPENSLDGSRYASNVPQCNGKWTVEQKVNDYMLKFWYLVLLFRKLDALSTEESVSVIVGFMICMLCW